MPRSEHLVVKIPKKSFVFWSWAVEFCNSRMGGWIILWRIMSRLVRGVGGAIMVSMIQSAVQNGNYSSIQSATLAPLGCSFLGFIGGAFLGYHRGQESYKNDLRMAGILPKEKEYSWNLAEEFKKGLMEAAEGLKTEQENFWFPSKSEIKARNQEGGHVPRELTEARRRRAAERLQPKKSRHSPLSASGIPSGAKFSAGESAEPIPILDMELVDEEEIQSGDRAPLPNYLSGLRKSIKQIRPEERVGFLRREQIRLGKEYSLAGSEGIKQMLDERQWAIERMIIRKEAPFSPGKQTPAEADAIKYLSDLQIILEKTPSERRVKVLEAEYGKLELERMKAAPSEKGKIAERQKYLERLLNSSGRA